MNTICLQLLEACITLYPANADGTPQLGSPIWSGAPAENLRLIERWIKKRTTPTGSLYQIGHPMVPVYELTIDRVWVLQLTASGPVGWNVDYEQYVLDIVWTDQETYQWHRKTLYGVTINERNWDARDVEHGFIDGQSFDGQYVVTSGGAPATQAQVISPTLPYLVYHTDETQTVLLYAYDPETGLFTAQTDTTDLATITTNPFAIQFAPMEYDNANAYQSGGSYGQNSAVSYGNANAYQNGLTYGQTSPVVWGSGLILGAVGVNAQAPSPTDLPRLDFYNGSQRIFSVTQNGIFESDIVETPVVPSMVPSVAYEVYNGEPGSPGAQLIAIFARTGLQASQILVQ